VNNSKKLKVKKVKVDRLIEQKPITKISRPWIITAAILVVALVGGLLFDQLYESTLFKINNEKYKLSDLAYYFYNVESEYNYYDQMFGGGGAYWDMSFDDEGTTVREQAKQAAIDTAISSEILYKEAVSADYTLTDEEKETISTNVTTLLDSQLTESVIKRNHFTKKSLTDVLTKTTLGARYRQDKIDAFDIDDEAIKAGINYDEYRQYDIEYLYISTQTTDEEGNTVALSDEEKTAAYDKINAVYESAKTSDDWSTLIADDEEELTYQDTNFLESGTTFSEDFEKMMMGMENDAVSEIYEDETGYYIVRMKDNDSSESYDTAVENAITTEENKQFNALYEEIKAKYDIEKNEKAIKGLNMGSLTI
jgi:foldase protein PrsA